MLSAPKGHDRPTTSHLSKRALIPPGSTHMAAPHVPSEHEAHLLFRMLIMCTAYCFGKVFYYNTHLKDGGAVRENFPNQRTVGHFGPSRPLLADCRYSLNEDRRNFFFSLLNFLPDILFL